eukprot:TRINITY_DN3625_c0_g3_i1.p1 TRINITY_DN3625_c0_g3~~TRINITY_DN3625_c0_g3_i1.p1  ORF type:complete len:253 (+),score=93.33 TRINITY_DN3625_c0_g3_i1:156-914(+)
MEVFLQRLQQEFNIEAIVTAPTVPFKITYRNGDVVIVDNPLNFPEDKTIVKKFEEPIVKLTLIFPSEYLGSLLKLCESRRGEQLDIIYITETRIKLIYSLPLIEIITDFFNKVKEASSGYATMDYEEYGYGETDLVKLSILLAGDAIDSLALIIHPSKANDIGKRICDKLKKEIPRQLFEVPIQACVGKNVIARKTISANRKDVTAKCYGGDVSRKRKLLEKQKEGKKKMKALGRVNVSQETFNKILKDNQM